MLGTVYSAGILRFDATLVKVEVDTANGLPSWTMVGSAEKAVQEAKERVGSALRNSGIKLEPKKTTINLAPATHKKSGNQYDLPIAMGLLIAHQTMELPNLQQFLFIGELSLTGELKPVHGTLMFAVLARRENFQALILPKANIKEAHLVNGVEAIGCESIAEVLSFLKEGVVPPTPVASKYFLSPPKPASDFADVKGQALARRAMEIAAAGNHHLLMIGPPGSGKTLLANALPSLLPPMSEKQSLETTKIYSALGLIDHDNPLMTLPPFRAPHHSTSASGLIGGGDGLLLPGEITLAHNGVLFLDELPEFHRDVLQMLRQPLESGWITITRAKGRLQLPSRFLLVACANPCRCGYLGHPRKACVCDPGRVFQYRNKISGPLLDRIDLHVETTPLTEEEIFGTAPAESSETVRQRVMMARERQQTRYKHFKFYSNTLIPHHQLKCFCPLTPSAQKFFRKIFPALQLSARAHDRILKVARTIADLADATILEENHIAEAAQYRVLDRENLS